MGFLTSWDTTTWWVVGGAAIAVLVVMLLITSLVSRKKKKHPSTLKTARTSTSGRDRVRAPTSPAPKPTQPSEPAARVEASTDLGLKCHDSPHVSDGANLDGPVVQIDLSKYGVVDRLIDDRGEKLEAGVIAEGVLALAPGKCFFSVERIRVKPGERWRAEFSARAISDSANGGRNNFFVGPITKNDSGETIQDWAEQPELLLAEGHREGLVDLIVAEGATVLQLGVHGTWAPETRGDGVIGILSLKLARVG